MDARLELHLEKAPRPLGLSAMISLYRRPRPSLAKRLDLSPLCGNSVRNIRNQVAANSEALVTAGPVRISE